MPANNPDIISLDVGEKRIGVARVNQIARIPQPLKVIINDKNVQEALRGVVEETGAKLLIVGLPRNMNGQETAQSQYVRQFCLENLDSLGLEYVYQDETLSSVEAEQRLKAKNYSKADIDTHAAVIILEDYLEVHR